MAVFDADKNTYKLLLTEYGSYPVALRAGLLPQHSVWPLIHLDYRGCKSPQPNHGSQRGCGI